MLIFDGGGAKLNRITEKLGLKGKGICSAFLQRHCRVLVEIKDNDAVTFCFVYSCCFSYLLTFTILSYDLRH